MQKTASTITPTLIPTLMLTGFTVLSGLVLSSTIVSADNDSAVDQVSITVPSSCTMSGSGMNSHNSEIVNGTYQADIGTTTLHAFCNDNEGFAIYAAGYTGDEIGGENSNKLVGTSASNNATIESGLATTAGNPDVSNWAMKLAITQDSGATTGTNAFMIDSAPNVALPSEAESGATQASFTQYHVVPNEYTKVAHKNSGTDMTATTGGVKLTTTYAAYISKTQAADTYSGQVIYTLVHPASHAVPVANPATLDVGRTVNSKLKSLAATVVNGEETTITPTFNPDTESWSSASDYYIKAIDVHLRTPVPADFTPSEMNTISSSISKKPVYIIFDNANDAGIMHFYTEGDQIFLPTDSSFMFYLFYGLVDYSDISNCDASNVNNMEKMFFSASTAIVNTLNLDLSSWDTSSVTNMNNMFYGTGVSAATLAIDISSWDTSNVTDMSYMFYQTGYDATNFTLNLSSWDTSNVTDMTYMFYYTGLHATTWSIGDLSSWDTSNVTDMTYMFYYTGLHATTWSIGDLSSWDTSNVTNMSNMFSYAGRSATTFTLDLSSWNTSNVTSMSYMFSNAGRSATTWSIGDLSSWNTSNVTNMSYMFYYAGYSATTWSIGDLSSWNTSNVTNMSYMFYYTGYSATNFVLNLSSWNTSSVTDMSHMFDSAGRSATTWSIGDLSSWNTSNVTNMSRMFQYAGYSATNFTLDFSSWNTSKVTNMSDMFYYAGNSATTWSVTIPQTNGNSINNTTSRLYGQTTSKYAAPPSGKSFTIAQP